MAGYRPLGLSSAAPSTIIAGRATSYADRRRAAAERLSTMTQIAERLDAAVEGSSATSDTSEPIDPEGMLRSSIRALIPLAYRTENFDVTVSLGPGHAWAARIRRSPDGVSVELVSGSGVGGRDAVRTGGTEGQEGQEGQVSASEAEIAAELASLLWTGEVTGR